jgi:hypothetical protein
MPIYQKKMTEIKLFSRDLQTIRGLATPLLFVSPWTCIHPSHMYIMLTYLQIYCCIEISTRKLTRSPIIGWVLWIRCSPKAIIVSLFFTNITC